MPHVLSAISTIAGATGATFRLKPKSYIGTLISLIALTVFSFTWLEAAFNVPWLVFKVGWKEAEPFVIGNAGLYRSKLIWFYSLTTIGLILFRKNLKLNKYWLAFIAYEIGWILIGFPTANDLQSITKFHYDITVNLIEEIHVLIFNVAFIHSFHNLSIACTSKFSLHSHLSLRDINERRGESAI